MKNQFAQTPFTIEFTADGSPTLKLPGEGESMHHSGGAATETDYIYKSVMEEALKRMPQLKLAVVGLGLGYIEISWAIACFKQNINGQSHFVSFETDPDLKSNFMNWLNSEEVSLYDDIVKALDPAVPVAKIKSLLLQNLERYPLKGDLLSDFEKNNSYNLICFDAFSRKTSEELWTEDFLTGFLARSAHPDCIFSTYACTGVLKRALTNNGFQLIQRYRFKSWRESSLAVRGVFTSGIVFRTS